MTQVSGQSAGITVLLCPCLRLLAAEGELFTLEAAAAGLRATGAATPMSMLNMARCSNDFASARLMRCQASCCKMQRPEMSLVTPMPMLDPEAAISCELSSVFFEMPWHSAGWRWASTRCAPLTLSWRSCSACFQPCLQQRCRWWTLWQQCSGPGSWMRVHWQASATADVPKRPWSKPGELRALTLLPRLCSLLPAAHVARHLARNSQLRRCRSEAVVLGDAQRMHLFCLEAGAYFCGTGLSQTGPQPGRMPLNQLCRHVVTLQSHY